MLVFAFVQQIIMLQIDCFYVISLSVQALYSLQTEVSIGLAGWAKVPDVLELELVGVNAELPVTLGLDVLFKLKCKGFDEV